MTSSIIINPIALLKNQPNKDFAHLFVGRLVAELRHCQRPGRVHQLLQLVFVVGRVKVYFHLVHRHRAAIAQSPLVVNNQPEIDALYMVVAGFFKGLIGKVYGQIKKLFAGVFVHVLILRELSNWRHSYFPKLLSATSSLFLPCGDYPKASERFVEVRK